MEMPKINERVFKLIDYYTDRNVKKFAESINIPQQTVNRLFNIDTRTGKYPLTSTDILISITEMYVDVDANWLLAGKGDMLFDKQSEQIQKPIIIYKSDPKDLETIKDKARIIALQEEKIRLLEEKTALHPEGLGIARSADTTIATGTKSIHK